MSLKKSVSILIKNIGKFVRHLLAQRFFRFLIVGGINTAFGYGVFALLVYVGMHYTIASFLSTVLGILFNFKTTGILVFRRKENSLIFRFFLVYGIVYLFNIAGLKLFVLVGVNNYAGGAILILPAAVLSYVLNKKLVFCR